jgi:hypothetical protein
VGVFLDLVAVGLDPSQWAHVPFARQDQSCEAARELAASAAKTRPAEALFPGERATRTIQVQLRAEEISASQFSFDDPTRKFIEPVVAGCVDYAFSFAPEEHRQYRLLYVVTRRSDKPPRAIEIKEGEIPVSDLRLHPWPFGGHGTAN